MGSGFNLASGLPKNAGFPALYLSAASVLTPVVLVFDLEGSGAKGFLA